MKVEPWVREILLGRKPAKTQAYQDHSKRREIINLFIKIRAVNAWISPMKDCRLAIELFKRNDTMIAKLKETVEFCYENNRHCHVRITFLRNKQLRIEIVASETKRFVYVRVPVIEDDW